jgi:heat shock protein HslJ
MRALLPVLTAASLVAGCAAWSGDPGADIRHIEWRATEIGGRPAADSHRPASMLLAAQNRASGSGGCNQWHAQYRLDGRAVSFGPIGSTRILCEGPVGDQERTFFDILQSVDRYSLTADGVLELATPQGQTIEFRRSR